MTDSSGRVDYQKVKKVIRSVLNQLKENRKPPKARDIWTPLQKQTNLKEAFLRSEITDYLKSLARFIGRARVGESESFLKEFGLTEESAFVTLQRSIRTAKDRKEETEYQGAAQRAFQLGSEAWARGLLHKTDPTKFKVKDIVEGIRRHPETALVSAEQLVLFEYGERLLKSAVPGGTTGNKDIASVLRDYRENCKEFARENPNGKSWDSEALISTVQDYYSQLTEQ